MRGEGVVGEILGLRRRVRADWESVGKGPIESDMILDGSDTFPGHAPVQRTQLRS